MLNLLFISDSPKVEYIKSVLQPVLKVIIDVVADFDHGLKDVFEKRPGTVCIQDQIGGVTGESVARHIQMLLGYSAPTFILLHTGNDKARPIKGLYDHLIDLSQPNDVLAEDIKNTLKLLLGDQWERIYIPPKPIPASARSSAADPEEAREAADKLVDDFLSDLETSAFLAVDDQAPLASNPESVTGKSSEIEQSETPWSPESVPGTVESDRAQAINDDLAELLLLERNKAARDVVPVAVPSAVTAEPKTASVKPLPHVITETAVPKETATRRKQMATTSASASEKKDTKTVSPQIMIPPPPAAEFRISQNTTQDEGHIPEELLLAFDENYRSESIFLHRTVVIALVCVVCAAGGWYFVTQMPQLTSSLKQRFMPAPVAKLAPVTAPAAIPLPRPVAPPMPQPKMIPPLPVFIPKDGHDSTFSDRNPGWERYVGKHTEFRLFSASGRIQAVQVLAVKDAPISESLVKSVLQEFTGSAQYQITSRTVNAGVRVENGKLQNKGDVKFYRKNGAVKAFVVSVN